MKIAVLHPGAMGSTIARALLQNNHEVFWVSEQRSDKTRWRAEDLGLIDLQTIRHACETVDVIISICMGGGVIPHATEVASSGFKGIFVDLNYVGGKDEANDLAFLLDVGGIRYVEGSVYGWPWPTEEGRSDERLIYLGGPHSPEADTQTVISLFQNTIFSPLMTFGSAKEEKQKRVESEITSFLSYEDHGYGVVEFHDVAPEIDDDFVDAWLERRRSVEPHDYTVNENGLYVSRGGYTFTERQIRQAPERYMNLSPQGAPAEDVEFHKFLQEKMFNCIHAYTGIYPECKDAVWWGADGHVAVYGEDAQMGIHHDTAVGRATGNENPVFLTVSGSLIISDRCNGGDLYFAHLKELFPPKKGSAVFYPAGYIGAHGVRPITSGQRISYLEFYGHGTRSGQIRKI